MGIAVLFALAVRLYPAQKVLERDAVATRASLTRSIQAENQLQKTTQYDDVVSATLAVNTSLQAWISSKEKFDAALQARNRRLHQFEWAVALLVAAWLFFLVNWVDSMLRKPALRQA